MSTAPTPETVAALLPEVAQLIVEALNLEVTADEIEPDAPLFGDGLGLDSIDVLETPWSSPSVTVSSCARTTPTTPVSLLPCAR